MIIPPNYRMSADLKDLSGAQQLQSLAQEQTRRDVYGEAAGAQGVAAAREFLEQFADPIKQASGRAEAIRLASGMKEQGFLGPNPDYLGDYAMHYAGMLPSE